MNPSVGLEDGALHRLPWSVTALAEEIGGCDEPDEHTA